MNRRQAKRNGSFFQALSSPAADSWPARSLHHGVRFLLLFALAGAITALFPPVERMEVERFEVGMVAEETVQAQVPFSVPKSEAELERDRAEARAAVPPTFNFEPGAADTMVARLERFFSQVDSAAASDQPGAVERVLESNSIFATPSQVGLLEDAETFALLRLTALDAARGILPQGVADGSQLESLTTDRITVRQRDEAERSVPREEALSGREFYDRAVALLPRSAAPDLQDLLRLLLIQFIDYTYRLNLPATELDRDAAARSVPTTRTSVLRGEAIVRAGDPITPDRLDRLRAYEDQLRTLGLLEDEQRHLAPVVGAGLVNLVLLAIFGLLLFFFRREIYGSFRWILLLSLLVAGYFGAAKLISVNGFPTELLPVAFVALAVAVLWDGRMALVLVLVLGTVTVAQPPFVGFPVLATTVVGGASAALSVRAVRRRAQTWLFIAIIVAAYAGILVALTLAGYGEFEDLWTSLLAAGGNATLSAILAMGFLPVFELFTGITTDQTLLEWADPNRPLLRRLSMEAPGTYAHTINVANLTEAAANAIGANGLLCRVGLYYHDVGKMLKPHYFVENLPDRRNPHDRLRPEVSAAIVKEHVTEGLKLARQEKVPDVVAAFIPEHHGTQLIGFFYEKAVEEYGAENVAEGDYRYPGPRPRSRETAIAMLADSVESATRVLQDPTPERVRDLIDNIVDGKIAAGQLDDAPLTLREIAQVKEQIVKALSGIYHHRVEYPATRHLTESDAGGKPPAGADDGEAPPGDAPRRPAGKGPEATASGRRSGGRIPDGRSAAGESGGEPGREVAGGRKGAAASPRPAGTPESVEAEADGKATLPESGEGSSGARVAEPEADDLVVLLHAGPFADVPAALLERAVRETLREGGVREAELSLALMDDRAIRDLNREHLGHDRPTDVLAFALWEPGEPVVGDVYVGVEQARRQALEEGVDPVEELVRLAVHGTLHVLGHDHPDPPAERAGSPMYRLQEALVRRLADPRAPSPGRD